MKNLQQYLETAKNYLYPDVESMFERERATILEYAKHFHLDEKFLELVAKDHHWRSISEKTQVFYYMDTDSTRKHPCHNDDRPRPEPDILLLIWDGGKDPVIKIIM